MARARKVADPGPVTGSRPRSGRKQAGTQAEEEFARAATGVMVMDAAGGGGQMVENVNAGAAMLQNLKFRSLQALQMATGGAPGSASGKRRAEQLGKVFQEDSDYIKWINAQVIAEYSKTAEARLQQPGASALGGLLPDVGLTMLSKKPMWQMGAGLISGATLPAETGGEQLQNAVVGLVSAGVGNRVGNVGGALKQRMQTGMVRPLNSNPVTQEALERLQDIGITLRPHEMTDNRVVERIMDAVDALPFGVGPAKARDQMNRRVAGERARLAVGLEQSDDVGRTGLLTEVELIEAEELAIENISDATSRIPTIGRPLPETRETLAGVIDDAARNITLNVAEAGDSAAPAAKRAMAFFSRDKPITGRELAEQRANVVQRMGEDIGRAEQAGLRRILGAIDNEILSGAGPGVADDFARAREQFRLTRTLRDSNAFDADGLLRVHSKNLNRALQREFRGGPFNARTLSNHETDTFVHMMNDFQLDVMSPLKSSGTAERQMATMVATGGLVGGGAAVGAGEAPMSGNPFVDAIALGILLPAGMGKFAKSNVLMRGVLGPSTPGLPRAGAGLGVAAAAGRDRDE